MVVLVAIISLFLLFLMMRRHAGATILAVVAGGFIDGAVNGVVTDFLSEILGGVPQNLIRCGLTFLLVIIMPLILYFRGEKGLAGVARVVQALALMLVMVVLVAGAVEGVFTADELSAGIIRGLGMVGSIVVLAGVGVAYWDVVFFKNSK